MLQIENPPVEIRTERLLIRRLVMADAPAIFDIFSHEDVARYGTSPAQVSLSEAEQKIAAIMAHYEANDLYQLGIERLSDGLLIGTLTLWQIHLQNRRAEVGYVLGRPHWGKGYMAEALAAWVDYAFMQMKLHRLEADIDPRNVSSAKSLERMGFLREGYLRERWIVGNEVSDSALYGLLASEWTLRERG